MIRFACPACQADIQVGDLLAGTIIACGKCGQSLVIPPRPPPPFLSLLRRRLFWLVAAGFLLVCLAVAFLLTLKLSAEKVPTRSRAGPAVLPEEQLVKRHLEAFHKQLVEPLFWGPHDLGGLLYSEIDRRRKHGIDKFDSRIASSLLPGDKLVRVRYCLVITGKCDDNLFVIRNGQVLTTLPGDSVTSLPYYQSHRDPSAPVTRQESNHARHWLEREIENLPRVDD
jgi:hypothetical protein